MKIGDIVTKAQYTAYAIFCNANNAHIEKQGNQYIVVENVTPTPTTEEQIAALDEQYAADKNELMQYFLQAVIDGDTATQAEIKAELEALAAAYDADLAELEGEDE